MQPKKCRLVIHVSEPLLAQLKDVAAKSDVSVGELSRRFLRLGLFADDANKRGGVNVLATN